MKDERDPIIDSSQEHEVRVKKVKEMRQAGIEPWPAFKRVTATCKQVLEAYRDDQESPVYALSGRVLTLRVHGKTIFAHIQDQSGRLQIYIRQDIVGDDLFNFFQHSIDLGDIIWVTGHSFKTKTGEVTLKITDVVLLSKCLHPLPDKFHGLSDIEVKYRRRYLDLISNPESRDTFRKRAKLISAMRAYLESYGFMEVETPMLQPIPGGAAAKPFVTHHNALGMDLFLRIAPELYLKQLVIGGFERVYEINRCFRNEGISTRHNPEFTTVEFYAAHEDYHFMMNFVEDMLKHSIKIVAGSLQLPFNDYTLDFESPFKRLSMKDAVLSYGNLKASDIEGNAIDGVMRKLGVEHPNKNASWGEKLSVLFEELAEDKLINPTFITHFPVEISPLAKRDPDDPSIAARFELFAAGMEIGNGFNELNDPFDQAARFHEQAKARAAGDVEAHYYDADYVYALEYGLPPTVGVGIGIDRLTMLATNAASIKDVILFPTLKKKETKA